VSSELLSFLNCNSALFCLLISLIFSYDLKFCSLFSLVQWYSNYTLNNHYIHEKLWWYLYFTIWSASGIRVSAIARHFNYPSGWSETSDTFCYPVHIFHICINYCFSSHSFSPNMLGCATICLYLYMDRGMYNPVWAHAQLGILEVHIFRNITYLLPTFLFVIGPIFLLTNSIFINNVMSSNQWTTHLDHLLKFRRWNCHWLSIDGLP